MYTCKAQAVTPARKVTGKQDDSSFLKQSKGMQLRKGGAVKATVA